METASFGRNQSEHSSTVQCCLTQLKFSGKEMLAEKMTTSDCFIGNSVGHFFSDCCRWPQPTLGRVMLGQEVLDGSKKLPEEVMRSNL